MKTDTSIRTLVVGASTNPERYSYKATERLLAYGHQPILLGLREQKLFDLPILKGKPAIQDVHTITMYINPKRQEDYYDYLIGLQPARIIFNPGTENPAFYKLAEAAGIETIEACTLVMLATDQFIPKQHLEQTA